MKYIKKGNMKFQNKKYHKDYKENQNQLEIKQIE